jgi:uncharacterized protein
MTQLPPLRASRYLNVIKLDNEKCLLFNGINACMDEVPCWLGEKLSSSGILDGLSPDALELLRRRGHVTALSPGEELSRFRELALALHDRSMAHLGKPSVMLLLSYNCNLACKYCYQHEHRPGKSSALITPQALDSFVERNLGELFPGHNCANWSFYGGEPFLPANLPTIRRALEYSSRWGTHAKAISNCTRVHEMPEIFGRGPGKVGWVQVSLDGDRAEHDSSRVPASGEPTFDRIIANISLLAELGVQVSIRLNLDRRKAPGMLRLLQYLKEKKITSSPNVSVYAAALHDNIAEVDSSDFMDVSELAARVFELGIDLEHPLSMRANDMSKLMGSDKAVGLNKTFFCMQTPQRSVVLDPFGDVYACFEEAGYPQYRIARATPQGTEFFAMREKYCSKHVANMPDCLQCTVALACGGQCGVTNRRKTGDPLKPDCADIRRVILESLKLAYKKRGETPAIPAAVSDVSLHG